MLPHGGKTVSGFVTDVFHSSLLFVSLMLCPTPLIYPLMQLIRRGLKSIIMVSSFR